jgi:carboxylesterase
LTYAIWVNYKYLRWEAEIERNAEGVRRGCGEFTVGRGDTALLMIHGFGDSPAVYQRLAPALAAEGYTCRAMRLPFFAMPLDVYAQTSADQWRQAVHAELRALRQRHACVVVVGHSLGAAVALDCLAESDDYVDAVILLAPLVEVSRQRSPLLSADSWFELLDHLLVFTDRIGLHAEEDPQKRLAPDVYHVDAFIPRRVIRELFTVVERNRRRPPFVQAPLLMVLSEHDTIIDNEAASDFFERCPAFPKRLRYVADSGHVLPMDTGWEELVDQIGDFLGGPKRGTNTSETISMRR